MWPDDRVCGGLSDQERGSLGPSFLAKVERLARIEAHRNIRDIATVTLYALPLQRRNELSLRRLNFDDLVLGCRGADPAITDHRPERHCALSKPSDQVGRR